MRRPAFRLCNGLRRKGGIYLYENLTKGPVIVYLLREGREGREERITFLGEVTWFTRGTAGGGGGGKGESVNRPNLINFKQNLYFERTGIETFSPFSSIIVNLFHRISSGFNKTRILTVYRPL